MIEIRKPLCFSELGRKDNQEDYLFPQEACDKTRTFILCDGMGGHDNGEVASRIAATALGKYLSSCKKVDIQTFEAGLSVAYDALDGIDTNSPRKPGTTMTCLCLNEDSYLVAHIGDSRIYHIRPSLYDSKTGRGGILYQSSDHSLVNDLLKAGELTEEEAGIFPQKNVITRAMQPHLVKRYKADIYLFDDIKSGDYFFLCCDGVLEQLSNEDLCRILADDKLDDSQKLEMIKSICDGKTRDNYTCWLIPVDNVNITIKTENASIIQADAELADIKEFQDAKKVNIQKEIGKHQKKNVQKQLSSFRIPRPNFNISISGQCFSKIRLKWLGLVLLVLCLLGAGGFYVYKTFVAQSRETQQNITTPIIEKHKIPLD